MSKFEKLNDPVVARDGTFVSGQCMVKFCNYGFVTSRKWTQVYLTLLDGIVRIYDSEDSCTANPQSYVMQIVMGRHHEASEYKTKNYSKDPTKVIDFYCFYIQVDNGVLAATRQLKVASADPGFIERLVKCIDLHTRGNR
jgi:hypothetical protein